MQGRFRNELLNSNNSIIDNLIAPTHLLKKVNQSVDFSFVNELTASCYSPNNGRPSILPELCFRILLIGYLFSIPSNRRLIEEVKYNRQCCKNKAVVLLENFSSTFYEFKKIN
jgi:transposase